MNGLIKQSKLEVVNLIASFGIAFFTLASAMVAFGGFPGSALPLPQDFLPIRRAAKPGRGRPAKNKKKRSGKRNVRPDQTLAARAPEPAWFPRAR